MTDDANKSTKPPDDKIQFFIGLVMLCFIVVAVVGILIPLSIGLWRLALGI